MIAPQNPDTDRICQLRIVLKDSDPPIWRQVLVPAAYTLGDLHRVIQAVMPWSDCHVHEFEVGDVHYGVPEGEEFSEDLQEEEEATLSDAFRGRRTAIGYVYDFSDGWEHVIELEEIVPRDPAQQYPQCMAGENAAPPEDSGTLAGYYDKLRILKEPGHPEHQMIKDWMPPGFNPAAFSVEKANILLRIREEDEDLDTGLHAEETLDPGYLSQVCAWCRKEIPDGAPAFAQGIRAREDADLARLGGSFIMLSVGRGQRQVPAMVTTSDSQARLEGKDLLIMVCSEACAEALDAGLREDAATGDDAGDSPGGDEVYR